MTEHMRAMRCDRQGVPTTANPHLKNLQPLLVVLGHLVGPDQLDVAAVARVPHDVVLREGEVKGQLKVIY